MDIFLAALADFVLSLCRSSSFSSRSYFCCRAGASVVAEHGPQYQFMQLQLAGSRAQAQELWFTSLARLHGLWNLPGSDRTCLLVLQVDALHEHSGSPNFLCFILLVEILEGGMFLSLCDDRPFWNIAAVRGGRALNLA